MLGSGRTAPGTGVCSQRSSGHCKEDGGDCPCNWGRARKPWPGRPPPAHTPEVLAPGGLTVRWLWRWERASRQRAWLKQRREEEVRVSSLSGGTIQSLWMSPTALRPSGLATNLSFLFPVGCSAPCTRYLREGSWGITLCARPLRLLGPPDSPTHICHLSVALLPLVSPPPPRQPELPL